MASVCTKLPQFHTLKHVTPSSLLTSDIVLSPLIMRYEIWYITLCVGKGKNLFSNYSGHYNCNLEEVLKKFMKFLHSIKGWWLKIWVCYLLLFVTSFRLSYLHNFVFIKLLYQIFFVRKYNSRNKLVVEFILNF